MNPELVFTFLGALSSDTNVTGDRKNHSESSSASRIPLSEATSIVQSQCPADETLLDELRVGNKEALGILFGRYARLVRAVAYRILRDASEADDLVQEIFLFIYRKGSLFDAGRGSARSWIVHVTYTQAIDRRRYLTTRHFYTSLELSDTTELAEGLRSGSEIYDGSIEGVLGKEAMREIAESLSENQRRVLELYFYEGYTLEEVAKEMMQTVGNIRNHYYRGLEKMRRQIFEAK
jgi:RNA polymerase sigma-70 factor (ECF subfamily)